MEHQEVKQAIVKSSTNEIVSSALPSPEKVSLDQNPAAVYLATLRPVGRRGMLRALTLIAEIAGGLDDKGQPFHTAFTFPWAALRYQHTAAIITALRERDYRPATINHALAALRGVLYQAWKLEQISTEDYNRAKDIKSVRGETLLRGRALAGDELTQLLNTCRQDVGPAGKRDAAMIAILYGVGLRRSEIVKLLLSDYNPAENNLKVRAGKGGKDRLCYLGTAATKALAEWLALRESLLGDGRIGNSSSKTGGDGNNEEKSDSNSSPVTGKGVGSPRSSSRQTPTALPLFCPIRKGGHLATEKVMTDQAVLTILEKRAREAGVEHFSPHDLRRTFISHLLDKGADIATVQKMAGHANVTTTARYDRRGQEAQKKAAELLDY